MQIPAWTYSQLDTYETCPRKFYHLRVLKDVSDPPTEATIWGSRVHEALEHRIKSGTPLPEGMTQWEPLAAKLDALPGEKLCEQKFAVDRAFQPADWSNAWSRGIADLTVLHGEKAATFDYKTGKRKPTEQLELYVGYIFAHFPEVTNVETGFIWLKEKKIDKETYTRDDVPKIWDGFTRRVAKLESSYERDKWTPRPSGLCKAWCPVLTCEFNGRRGK